MDGVDQVGRRPGRPAGRRHRRHDPHLAVDLPRRGGGQGRLGDPQVAQAAPARPRADRLPDLRPASVRHGHGRHRHREAPRGLRRPHRGRRAGLRGQRHRRGVARGLRYHRREERGPDLRPRQAAAEGSAGAPGRRAVRRDRQVDPAWVDRGRRAQGRRGRRLAREDRERERRRADARAPGQARGRAGTGQANAEGNGHTIELPKAPQPAKKLDETVSPTAGRRFTRA